MLRGLISAALVVLALSGHVRCWDIDAEYAPYADQIDWSPIDQLLQQQIAFVTCRS